MQKRKVVDKVHRNPIQSDGSKADGLKAKETKAEKVRSYSRGLPKPFRQKRCLQKRHISIN